MPTSNYGPTTTAAEVVADVDLHGRRAIVTGASSGIGTETARALASAGADVTLAVRNVQAGNEVANGIAEKLSPGWRSGARRQAGSGRPCVGGRFRAQLVGTTCTSW